MLFRPKDRRLSLTELTSSFKPYSSAQAPLRPLLVASLRTKRNSFRRFSCPALQGAGHAALTALPHYYQGPDFSPRLTKAFRSLPYSLAYPSGSSALRHEHHQQEHDEISPGQTPLFLSVPPAHTLSLSTLRKYFLRLKAAGSVMRARGRPVRLWLTPRLRPGDLTQALRIPSRDGHPALLVKLITRPPGLPGFLSTHPPCQGAAGLSPARKAPCWAHNSNPTIVEHGQQQARTARPEAVGIRARSSL